MTTGVVALIGAAIVWLGVAGAATSPSCANAVVHQGASGVWTVYDAPVFGAGTQQVTAHAVDPEDPSHWYVTNGTSIYVSQDGGCHWRHAYTLPAAPSAEMPLVAGTAEIRSLSAGGGRMLALVSGPTAVDTQIPGAPQADKHQGVSELLRSTDAGATFTTVGPWPDQGGAGGPVAQAPSAPDVVYVATGQAVRRSMDGGRTFGAPSQVTDSANPLASVQQLVVDPVEPGHVWARVYASVFQASDGSSFNPYPAGGPYPSGASVFGPAVGHESGGRPAHVVFTQGNDQVTPPTYAVDRFLVSEDGGKAFAVRGQGAYGTIDGHVVSTATGTGRTEVAMTTASGGVYLFSDRYGRFLSANEFRLGRLDGAAADRTGRSTFHFFQPRKLVAWKPPPGGLSPPDVAPTPTPTPVPADATPDPSAAEPDAPKPSDSLEGQAGRLAPAGGDVHVPAGGTAAVDYSLDMAARAARLDTFFMLDTSNSTDPYIRALSNGLNSLAHGLVGRNVDGWFGLGEYQDISGSGVRYRRRADLRPPDDYLKSRFDTINTAGGDEPGYTAIDQAVTGAGVRAPRSGPGVPPGQDAHWRRATERLILHVADEPFSDDPDGARRDQVVRHLLAHDTQFMGIMVVEDHVATLPDGTPVGDRPVVLPGGAACNGAPPPNTLPKYSPAGVQLLRCQLEDLARATHTVAPPGGVDCDGDGVVDVPAGQPLVCIVPKGKGNKVAGLADAVQRLLLAIPLVQPVSLVPAGRAAQPSPPVKVDVSAGGDYSLTDIRQSHAMTFHATFSCPPGHAGKAYAVKLEARLATLPFAEAVPRVFCDGGTAAIVPPPTRRREAAAQPPPPQPRAEKALAAAAPGPAQVAPAPVTPQLPPPARVHAPAPAAVPQAAQAPASGQVINTQAAQGTTGVAVDQQQESPVLQRVHVDEGRGPEQLHFSRADGVHASEPAWLLGLVYRMLGVAGVLCAGALTLRRSRNRTQIRKVHER